MSGLGWEVQTYQFVFSLFFNLKLRDKENVEPQNQTSSGPTAGGAGHTLRLHGGPPEERQHGSHGPLLRYLHSGSHLPRLHQNALRLGRQSHQKGRNGLSILERGATGHGGGA